VVGRVVAVSLSYRRRVLMWLWCRGGIVVVWASLCWVGRVIREGGLTWSWSWS
jgi:hypothetical protein